MDSLTDAGSKASISALGGKPAISEAPALAAEKATIEVIPFEISGAGADVLEESRGAKRHLSKLALLGMCFAILNTWSASSISIYLGFTDGGPVSIVWGMVAATLFNLSIAASLSELCHVYPTAGAQYHWQYALTNAKSALGRVGTYITGFLGAAGWIVLTTAGPVLVASYLETCITLYHPDYMPRDWVRFILYMVIILYSSFICTFGARILDGMNKVALFSSLTGATVVFVVLLACSGAHDTMRDGKWVFATLTNETTWPDGVCWILGLLNAQFSIVGADASAHLVSEVPVPSMDAPMSMVVAVVMGGTTGTIVLIAFLAAVTNATEAVNAQGGAFLLILYQAIENKAGAIVVSIFVILTMFFTVPAIQLTSNHMVASLARDNMIPFGKQLGSTSERWELPVWANVFTTFWLVVIGCLEFGPSQVLVAVQSSSVVLLEMSYLPCTFAMLFWGRRRMAELGIVRRWSLGRWGPLVNVCAIAFQIITIVFFLFPQYGPIKTVNGVSNLGEMNWSVAVVGVIFVLGIINWFAWARTRFEGPSEFLEGPIRLQPLYG